MTALLYAATQYLSEGRGACFLVEPGNVKLQAFETVQVAITAHADMWGHYKDQLCCKVRMKRINLSLKSYYFA